MLVCTFCCWCCEDQIPEITELEKEGLCDVRQGDCSTIQVYGQGFKDSYELKCEFVKEKVLCFSASLELIFVHFYFSFSSEPQTTDYDIVDNVESQTFIIIVTDVLIQWMILSKLLFKYSLCEKGFSWLNC